MFLTLKSKINNSLVVQSLKRQVDTSLLALGYKKANVKSFVNL